MPTGCPGRAAPDKAAPPHYPGSRLEWSIVNAYSEAYHFNGHDSAAAKLAAQHKAAEIGALDLFRQMYRTA